MSFGFSVGDFVTVLNLVKGICNACQNGPKEYRELCREIKSLGAVTSQLFEDIQDPYSLLNRKGVARRKDLLQIMENCEEALREVEAFVEKHSVLDTERSYDLSNDVAKRTWHNYKVGAENLDTVRGKLTFYTSTITLFLNSLETSALGRIESKIDKLYAKLIFEDKRNSITSVASTASLMSFVEQDEPDEEAWDDLRTKLVEEGVSAADIEQYRDCIVEYMKALIINSLPPEIDMHDILPQTSDLEPHQGLIERNLDTAHIRFLEPLYGTVGSSSACLIVVDIDVQPQPAPDYALKHFSDTIQLVLSSQTLDSEPDLFFWNSAFPRFLRWSPGSTSVENIHVTEQASYRPRHNDISYEEHFTAHRSTRKKVTSQRLEVDRGVSWILRWSPRSLSRATVRLAAIVATGTKPFRLHVRFLTHLGVKECESRSNHVEITPQTSYRKLDQIDLANIKIGHYEELLVGERTTKPGAYYVS